MCLTYPKYLKLQAIRLDHLYQMYQSYPKFLRNQNYHYFLRFHLSPTFLRCHYFHLSPKNHYYHQYPRYPNYHWCHQSQLLKYPMFLKYQQHLVIP